MLPLVVVTDLERKQPGFIMFQQQTWYLSILILVREPACPQLQQHPEGEYDQTWLGIQKKNWTAAGFICSGRWQTHCCLRPTWDRLKPQVLIF